MKYYVLGVLWLIYSAATFGYIAPFLISQTDYFAVAIGICLMIAYFPVSFFVLRPFMKLLTN